MKANQHHLREAYLSLLDNEWGRLPDRFTALSPASQAAYLQRQGYQRLGDLLAHISAWWHEGMRVVRARIEDPGYASPEYNVDAFNAKAVKAAQGRSDAALTADFHQLREAWRALLCEMPEACLREPSILQRLEIELRGHYEEHALADG